MFAFVLLVKVLKLFPVEGFLFSILPFHLLKLKFHLVLLYITCASHESHLCIFYAGNYFTGV